MKRIKAKDPVVVGDPEEELFFASDARGREACSLISLRLLNAENAAKGQPQVHHDSPEAWAISVRHDHSDGTHTMEVAAIYSTQEDAFKEAVKQYRAASFVAETAWLSLHSLDGP